MNVLSLWENPLVMRGIRTRLRLPMMASWGLVTVVASTFLYLAVSGNAMKFGNTTAQEAAREAILPLLIMQGLILMVLGTGAVAGGMARERTYRLLDYQRLTPMSPSAKIIGLLMGLPIREYFMFAVSLPFVFYAAWKGGLSFIVLLQFYLVFITSAIVYHMTGLAAGMIVNKPWQAGTVSQGLVVVLYLLLPQASKFGFTFFEYLTARPVFYGLVNQYLLPDGLLGMVEGALAESKYDIVAFFGLRISPVIFSLAVQGGALISLFVIVHRKWQSESRLAFSKTFALVFFAGAQLFLVGSVQPLLKDDQLFAQLAASYGSFDPVSNPDRAIVFAILLVNLLVSGCAAILTLYLCTPSWYQSIAGLRRVIRRGGRYLRWDDDTASSLPIAIACILMSALGFVAVYQAANSAGRIDVSNSAFEILLPLLFFAAVLLTKQQVIEQFNERIFVMSLFVFWLIPFLAMIIIATVANQWIIALYVAVTLPLVGMYFAVSLLMSDPSAPMDSEIVPHALAGHATVLAVLSLVIYGLVALALLVRARRRWARIRQIAGAPEGQATVDTVIDDVPADAIPAPVYVQSNDPPSPR